jgi:hypothetical protein
MPRKKAVLFSEQDQEQAYVKFLRERGWAVFKLDDLLGSLEEEECVRKLRAIGYKIEHLHESLTKVDPTKIKSTDDIVVYFHEMMRRFNKKRFNEAKIKDESKRAVDRSIVNSYVNWRLETGGVSLYSALEELFVMIDILFEKYRDQDIRSLGILSVTKNKPFVLMLLQEVNIKRDGQTQFEADQIIREDYETHYLERLKSAQEQMRSVTGKVTAQRKKIFMR